MIILEIDEITLSLHSNHLNADDDGISVYGSKYMRKWNIRKYNNQQFFIEINIKNKKKILTLNKDKLKIQENEDIKNQTFCFIDIK